MRVMVTGCNGQVGFCLVQQLKQDETCVLLAMDKDELNIVDAEAVLIQVQRFKPDVIINAAAYTAVDKAENEQDIAYAINCDGPANLAKAAQSINAAILHISTDYVFAGNKSGEYSEEDATGPQSIYGSTKLAGEVALANECPRHVILRTAWVFGEHGNNFVKTMLRLAKSRDSLSVVSDQFGGPTYAGDIAAALIIITKAIINDGCKAYGTYHYSGLPYVSWYDFAKAIFASAREENIIEKLPSVNAITSQGYPTPAKRPANSRLNTRKINQIFNIQASDWLAALNKVKVDN